LEESGPSSLAGGGGGDEVNQEEGEKQGEGEATPPKYPPTKKKEIKKRKVSLQKPLARKKTHTSKPQMEATLTEDDISLVCRAVEDVSENLF
jgi:hypothetical protein